MFFEDRVTSCGHEIDKDGLWKCNDKVQTVIDTPTPKDVTSLRTYLGIFNYYHRFLPNLATVIKPLNAMLEKIVSLFGQKNVRSRSKIQKS